MRLPPEALAKWKSDSLPATIGKCMTDVEIGRVIQKICEAFGATVSTQFKVAAYFVEQLEVNRSRNNDEKPD